MKSLLSCAIAASLALPANAVIVTLGTGTFQGAVADESNVAIPDGTGYIAVGYFDSGLLADGDIATAPAGDIVAAFNQFTASTGTFGSGGFDGFINFATSGQRVGAADPEFGRNLYIVMGNGPDITGSSQLAVFKANETFPDDSGSALDADITFDFTPTGPEGAWLMGTGPGGTTSVIGTDIPTVTRLAPIIPEPSVAALGLLGFLGLLRRRR
jgi:uncharacterized protein (TIGR03382 family)